MERCFFRFFPATKKQVFTADGEWMRCVSLITCIIHVGLLVFCLALVGAGAMIMNFLQAAWIYSVYLTMREREMVVYLILLLGQIGQCLT